MRSTSEAGGRGLAAPHRYRLTVRMRLALTYATLLTVAGLIMLTIVFVFLGLLTTYEFAAPLSPALPADPATPAVGEGEFVPGPAVPAETTEALVVSTRSEVQTLLLIVSGVVLVLLAVGGIWAGWLVAGRMLRPLQYVGAAARRAARGQFDHRIALAGPRDEITDLAETFDEMLGELERSFDSYRRFAANASHELRTPLATTRAMLDVALASATEAERPLLTRLRTANERSVDTVEALLDLSEIESVAARREPVELSDLLAEAVGEVTAEAKHSGVSIESRLVPATVDGDRSLLRQLALNLLQNAIRHNAPGGHVHVSIRSGGGGPTTLEVINDGDAVPADLVERLADPFVRGAGRTSRASTAGRGLGLGLSIVAAIVDRHGAALRLSPRAEGGLEVRVTFPSRRAHRPE
ncbi:HAMP domain-containing histidine kinase [Agromyces sp. SYSU K20354]|uniref:sensor histidine kinase n=1 Tax=Agromyces cavernae TaxID=2898659 RepID=UPI001E3C0586|nr:HAMP domain-containing sensor histidine kinase [Agromyces cavernae]MCD2442519.1 HAMP domain-containing histidine kinase [Agromyces cavernae]